MNEYYVSKKVPVHFLDTKNHFNSLTLKEKKYAYNLYKASWEGSPIVFKQVSPESWDIYLLLKKIYKKNSVKKIKDYGKKNNIESEIDHFLNYSVTFFGNMGNYYSYGDKKFIPRTKKKIFTRIVKHFTKDNYNDLINIIYKVNDKNKLLDYPEDGVTSYYSSNLTKKEIKNINDYMISINMSPYNTIVTKEKNIYIIHVASEKNKIINDTYKNIKVNIHYGNFSKEMKNINKYLEDSLKYVSNNNQKNMIKKYIKHYKNGDINEHKNSQKYWVKDKGPSVETNHGFIESYRDPSGVRGEFESFVSVVNKKMSERFNDLVNNSKKFISSLPWNKDFKKSKFLKPDFTSLEILTFVGSGIPLGINIPNYDDIRQEVGFKNVSLGNILRSKLTPKKNQKFDFILKRDQDIYRKFIMDSFEIQVGGHELFGHGSGKLFMETGKNKYNFNKDIINPLTNKKIKSWYKLGETYDMIFGELGSPYEECRAECVGLYLSSFEKMSEIFGLKKYFSDICYINWLNMILSGIRGLLMYDIKSKRWGQAHSHARYVIFNVLKESKIFQIEKTKNNFKINLNRNKIQTDGINCISNFLIKLQVYKSTANYKKALKLFKKYSKINDSVLELREIVKRKKKPRSVFIQPTLKLKNDKVIFKSYKNTIEDSIKSFMDKNI
jgi:dipeptidyl-peptidase III